MFESGPANCVTNVNLNSNLNVVALTADRDEGLSSILRGAGYIITSNNLNGRTSWPI